MIPSVGTGIFARQHVFIGRAYGCTRLLSYVAAAAASNASATVEGLEARLKDKKLLRLQGYIGGQWTDATDESTFDVSSCCEIA